jgi:hypothetical protein
MPAYGMLVVPGHHTIEVPSNSNTPVDIMDFVSHFKNRVFAGLGVSPVAMGEVSTSNRNTSEVLDTSMQTVTNIYQRIIKHKIEQELLREFLLDGRFQSIDDEIEFKFPEIDLEAQIKKETHIIQKFQNNLVTRTEARLEMDYDAKIDDKDTFLQLVDIPKIEAQAAAKAVVAAASPSAKKATDYKVRPANQHGRSSGRPKFVKNYLEDFNTVNSDLLDNLLIESNFDSNLNKAQYRKKIKDIINTKLRKQIDYEYINLSTAYNMNIKGDTNLINNYLSNAERIFSEKIDKLIDSGSDIAKFGILKNDLNDFVTNQKIKIENLATLIVLKSSGYKTILINTDNCDKHTSKNIDLESLTYNDIPPIGYECKCMIDEEWFNEKH